jgi:hypothetical protein
LLTEKIFFRAKLILCAGFEFVVFLEKIDVINKIYIIYFRISGAFFIFYHHKKFKNLGEIHCSCITAVAATFLLPRSYNNVARSIFCESAITGKNTLRVFIGFSRFYE